MPVEDSVMIKIFFLFSRWAARGPGEVDIYTNEWVVHLYMGRIDMHRRGVVCRYGYKW